MKSRHLNLIVGFTVLCGALLLPHVSGADELGRLFTTPEERSQLEREAKQKKTAPRVVDAGTPGNPDAPATMLTYTINGGFQRPDGSYQVWVNGVSQIALPGRKPETLKIRLPGYPEPFEAKIGQRLVVADPTPPEPTTADEED